jgi:hypothetical protein
MLADAGTVTGLEARAAVGGDALFVGRGPELDALGGRLERALAGSGGLVLVAGEAGIGKTRMLAEFALAARERGALALWGASFEGDWHPPYGPWVEVLGDAVRSLDPARVRQALGRGAPVLARLLPELGPALGEVPAVASLSPEEERFRLFDAVAQFLVAVAARQPVVLVLDDLHWTDGTRCSCWPTAAGSSAGPGCCWWAPTATPPSTSAVPWSTPSRCSAGRPPTSTSASAG